MEIMKNRQRKQFIARITRTKKEKKSIILKNVQSQSQSLSLVYERRRFVRVNYTVG